MFEIDEKKLSYTFSFAPLFESMKYRTAEALLEGQDIIPEDREEIRALFLACMDRYGPDGNRIVLPVVRRVVGTENLSWRKIATFENIEAFLLNPHVIAISNAAREIHQSNVFKVDLEAEYMAMLATAFVTEYKNK